MDKANECAWCGAELSETKFANRAGEEFCSKSHRQESNEALKNFLEVAPQPITQRVER